MFNIQCSMFKAQSSIKMKYILCIGSNTEPEKNMELAVKELTRHFPFVSAVSRLQNRWG